jgi:FtsH-binding integral membrane protein
MAKVFAWMCAGLALTAGISYGLSTQPELLATLFSGGLRWVVFLAPLGFAFLVAPRMHKMDPMVAKGAFLVYAALIGVWLSPLPIVYAAPDIFGAFATASFMFAGMAAFGYFTKKDLSGMGRFLFMAVWGLLVAWVVSWIIPGVYFYVAAIGVLIFAALTAYDTQKIKQIYLTNGGRGNLAILGALTLYVDFVNIFVFLLHLFGGSRR